MEETLKAHQLLHEIYGNIPKPSWTPFSTLAPFSGDLGPAVQR